MEKVFIIAEAGINHNGCLKTAFEMIEVAASCNVDAIKFQTYVTEDDISIYAEKAQYQKTLDDDENQFLMAKRLELSYGDFRLIKEHCERNHIAFMSSPFEMRSVDFLYDLGVDLFKIPSSELTNFPYLVKVAEKNLPVILSTGMATLQEIGQTVDLLKSRGCGQITLLQCNTEYPTPYEDVNLRAMITLNRVFCLPVGFSDHTLGFAVPLAAVALGATVIEKHFTLDKNMKGPDHKASLEPDDLKQMVSSIRIVEKSLGSDEKKPTCSERKNIITARKSIVAGERIKQGAKFTEDNLAVKRPGNGIDPFRWLEIIGKYASRDYEKDELIDESEMNL